jgi:hypothetical protein
MQAITVYAKLQGDRRYRDQGRDSINYSSQTERRAIVSREEIAALPNLAGYWKHGDAVVPFRIDFREWKKIAESVSFRGSHQNRKWNRRSQQRCRMMMPWKWSRRT